MKYLLILLLLSGCNSTPKHTITYKIDNPNPKHRYYRVEGHNKFYHEGDFVDGKEIRE